MYAHITNAQTHTYVHTYVCTYVHMYIPTVPLCKHTLIHKVTNPCMHSRFPHMYVVSSLLFLYRHRPLQSHAFIPYSHWLGGILRDIHRVLLLAASTEGNSKTLVQILKVCTYRLLDGCTLCSMLNSWLSVQWILRIWTVHVVRTCTVSVGHLNTL